MKVLVVGSSGWIGGYVLKELAKYKSVKVVDEKEIPDAVIYLAWPALDNYDSIEHLKHAAPTFKFIRHLISKGVKNITVTGTCFEYGKAEGELSEDMPTNPANNYALAKDTLRKAFASLDCSLKWLRLFYLYGNGQRETSLIPKLEKAIFNGDKEFFISGLNKNRDYLHVEKAAEYIVKCALQIEVKGVINVCSGVPTAIGFLAEWHKDRLGSNIEIKESDEDFPDLGGNSFWGNNEKLKRIISK